MIIVKKKALNKDPYSKKKKKTPASSQFANHFQ